MNEYTPPHSTPTPHPIHHTRAQDLVHEYSGGPLIALQLCGDDAVAALRSLAGPRDVDVARRIR